LVFATLDGQILAAPFDAGKMEVTGGVVPLVQGVGVTASEDVMYTLSENGTLLYWSAGVSAAASEMIWVSRSGEISPVDPAFTFNPNGANHYWRLSPDGTKVAFQDNREPGGDVWIKQLDRGPVSRLTFHAGTDMAPEWSADGQSVLYLSDRGGQGIDVWTQKADGTGEPTLVLELEQMPISHTQSPDGSWVVFRTMSAPTRDIFAQQIGETTPIPVSASQSFDENAPAISPDGRWIAYVSDETGEPQVYVRPFPDVDAGRWQVSNGPGVSPLWSHSGRELFFATLEGLMAAQVETSPSFRVIGQQSLFRFPPGVQAGIARGFYDVSPDDQRFLMARPAQFGGDDSGSQIELIMVENFFEVLKDRVPN
jgi:serine/threonine-protein kinase